MLNDDKILVGDIVTPLLHDGENTLMLWGTKKDSEDSEDMCSTISCRARAGDVLIVLEIKKNFSKEGEDLSEEWKEGAVNLLNTDGCSGWTGIGWVRKLPPTPHS